MPDVSDLSGLISTLEGNVVKIKYILKTLVVYNKLVVN